MESLLQPMCILLSIVVVYLLKVAYCQNKMIDSLNKAAATTQAHVEIQQVMYKPEEISAYLDRERKRIKAELENDVAEQTAERRDRDINFIAGLMSAWTMSLDRAFLFLAGWQQKVITHIPDRISDEGVRQHTIGVIQRAMNSADSVMRHINKVKQDAHPGQEVVPYILPSALPDNEYRYGGDVADLELGKPATD